MVYVIFLENSIASCKFSNPHAHTNIEYMVAFIVIRILKFQGPQVLTYIAQFNSLTGSAYLEICISQFLSRFCILEKLAFNMNVNNRGDVVYVNAMAL